MDATASIAHDIVWYATLGVCVLIGGGVVWCLVIILWCINNRRYLMRRSLVWLEITPPATATKTPKDCLRIKCESLKLPSPTSLRTLARCGPIAKIITSPIITKSAV